MAIPDYQSIMLPLLELAADNQIRRVHDAVDLLARQFRLTDEEKREVIPSGRVSRFHNNVTWARTYLKLAGLLEDPKRGEFRITERGSQVLAGKHESIGVRFLGGCARGHGLRWLEERSGRGHWSCRGRRHRRDHQGGPSWAGHNLHPGQALGEHGRPPGGLEICGRLAGETSLQGRLHRDIFLLSRSQGLRGQHRYKGDPHSRNATHGAYDRLRRWRHDRRYLRGEADRCGLLR